MTIFKKVKKYRQPWAIHDAVLFATLINFDFDFDFDFDSDFDSAMYYFSLLEKERKKKKLFVKAGELEEFIALGEMLDILGMTGVIGDDGILPLIGIIGIERAASIGGGRHIRSDLFGERVVVGIFGNGHGCFLTLIDIRAEAVGVSGGLFHVFGAKSIFDIDAIHGGITAGLFGDEGIGSNGASHCISTAPDGTHHIIGVFKTVGQETGSHLLINLAITQGSLKTDHRRLFYSKERIKN
jgi:hypothetical protein